MKTKVRIPFFGQGLFSSLSKWLVAAGLVVALGAASPEQPPTQATPSFFAQAGDTERLRNALNQLRNLAGQLEADRLLLAELRKDFPDDMDEAQAYLERLKELALKSDPARLGPLATRMVEKSSPYLKWRDKEYTTAEEAAREYARSGAREFQNLFNQFNNAVLQTVVTHIDALLSQLESVR
ncbi:hypothetical protein [Calidithermus roseus]|uniref:Uncharacterized protein n=1 Tax=Calidithermus roseus TaxID=1644118 RepID=A0A399EHB4_9DEIN|nr:hypothetical protein [Calidithermus roseus]RIH81672.1 hypothetical protein Mrose_03555 [Calidithermus roseus]